MKSYEAAPNTSADKMIKTTALTFLAIAIPFFFLLSPTPPKYYYHNLFITNSLYDNASVSEHLYILTRRPHVAGTEANAEAANYVLSTLTAYGIKSYINSYDVSLTYPVSRYLTLERPDSDQPVTFNLQQEIYDGDPYADVAGEVLPTFHAYAKSGNVKGPVAYVNYGRVEDFTKLKDIRVNLTGTIALARYGKIYRGDIVHNAHEAGAMGVIIYTDRKDFGGGSKAEGWFPEARWMPPSGVQVGSVYDGNGDPTTPGWPSITGCERLTDNQVDKGGYVPLIPSLPVSGDDGEAILKEIGGQVADEEWQGSEDAPIYRVGPGPGVVNLSYTGKQVVRSIQNVIAIIEGAEEPDRFVLLGNHRDAWTFGAVDPNSGTAVLLEIAQRLKKLQKRGWRPRRTIVLCNWDAEEYGLIGSTEWVEDNREMLSLRAVAYLNVDIAVSGPGFYVSATPQLDELIREATQQVQDPDNSSQTIYEAWVGRGSNAEIGRLGGAGSDYAAFVQHIGIASSDMSYGRGDYPVYHSMYDDFIWMKNFGDHMFQRHIAGSSRQLIRQIRHCSLSLLSLLFNCEVCHLVDQCLTGLIRIIQEFVSRTQKSQKRTDQPEIHYGFCHIILLFCNSDTKCQLNLWNFFNVIHLFSPVSYICSPLKAVASIWGLVALRLADDEILPFNYLSYAYELQKCGKELETEVLNKNINLIPLFNSIEVLKEAATKINEERKAIEKSRGWSSTLKKDKAKLRQLNDRLMMAERAFTDRDGLSERQWYKHLIYAPAKHNDYGSKAFPGIDDAIRKAENLKTAESWQFVQHEVWRVSRALRHVSLVLKGELT
ncbi:hypothetical protein K2173_023679 [Erythroxylum novogranatense]|uniref:Glutamate carboxypeptidase 2 n=1 Tax=Erythroxylum novogranatense TaxID=1862640 RepID=A0AAV8TPA9_9ROSI|nr:hypothetical protein K2173_023679 [Erythroxylum novogranatense]